MIHIDHSLLNAPTPPTPAKPLRADQLLAIEEKQRSRFTRDGRRPVRLSTACPEVDELLGGEGMERGIVIGISAEGGEGRLISLNLLASVLLSNLPTSSETILSPPRLATKANIIDTTGSFPLALFAKILKSRIQRSRASLGSASSGSNEGKGRSVDEDVQRCLEMVGISRVFDVEGLWEVLGEIDRVPVENQNQAFAGAKGTTIDDKHADGEESAEKEREIANSEDEDSDIPLTPSDTAQAELKVREEGVEIVIVDNMTHIINELFSRKEKSEAHTLLTLLSQTLTSLSQTSNILTILHNTTVPSKPSFTSLHQNNNEFNYQQQPHPISFHDRPRDRDRDKSRERNRPTQPTSVFPSNPIKPALGQIFTQFPSLHIFFSSLPKMTTDAELLYGGGDGGDDFADSYDINSTTTPSTHQTVNYCTVLEILKDESPISASGYFASRENTWCALSTSSNEPLCFTSAFPERGNMKGLGLQGRMGNVLGERTQAGGKGLHDGNSDAERMGRVEGGVGGGIHGERLTGREVSNIAKIYGFGGRRV